MKRKRLSNSLINKEFTLQEKENIKRICLACDKIGNVLLKLHPMFDQVRILSHLTERAKEGEFFIKIGYDGHVLSTDSEDDLIAMDAVNWQKIMNDLNCLYAIEMDISVEGSVMVLPEDIVDEISYEIERQDMEIEREKKQYLMRKRLNESKSKTKRLIELNDQPLYPGPWRKEPYPPRVYVEKLEKYKATNCVDDAEKQDLIVQLQTNLAGFQGPAYNYDDHNLTETWMKSFEDMECKY